VNNANFAFFHGKCRWSSSYVGIIILSNFFFHQKNQKRRFIEGIHDVAIQQTMKENTTGNIQTTGEGEE
jgi:hypothetical protein